MITISFYDLTIDPRIVDKGSVAGGLSPMAVNDSGDEYLDGIFREESDIINPVIRVGMDAKYLQDFNYVKIDWPTGGTYLRTRWYFVRGRQLIRNGLVEISLHEDVLYTWKSIILNSTGYILRSESTLVDPMLIDDRRTFSAQDGHVIVNSSTYDPNPSTSPFNPIPGNSGYRFSLKLANPSQYATPSSHTYNEWMLYPDTENIGSDIGNITYALNKMGLQTFYTLFMSQDFETFMKKALYGVGTEGIISILSFPFDLHVTDVVEPATSKIKMFGTVLDNSLDGYVVIPNAFKTVDFGTFTYNPDPYDFTAFEPYTSAQLYLPYYGLVDIPVKSLYGAGCSVKYVINIHSGDCVIYVQDVYTHRYIMTVTCMIGEKVPITRTNSVEQARNAINAGMSLVSSGMSAAAGNMTGLTGMANSLVNLAMNPLTMTGSVSEPILDRMKKCDPYVLITKKVETTPANYAHYIGRPMNEIHLLSDLTGFTQVGELWMNVPFMDHPEFEEIRSLLTSGVLL